MILILRLRTDKLQYTKDMGNLRTNEVETLVIVSISKVKFSTLMQWNPPSLSILDCLMKTNVLRFTMEAKRRKSQNPFTPVHHVK